MTTEGSAVYRRRDATTTADDAETPEIRARRGPATLARFARPRADTRTTLAVVSDPHLSTDKEGTWKVFHRTEDRLRAAIADANDRGVDGVVFAGDLTEDGRPEDFDGAADVLADLDAPFVAVPGNHDVPKAFDDHDTPPVAEFADRFAPGEFPFRTQFGGVDVLGLNSASAPGGELDATHDGAISDDQLSWLESTLPETDAALVVSHHNLPGLDAAVGADGYAPHPPVGDAPAFVDALAGHDALHLSGHVHLPAAITGDVRGLVCPALSSFPQAYTLAEVGPEGTTLRMVPVADTEGVEEAHHLARTHSDRSGDIAAMVEDQLSDLPLVDER
ncbi:metallophosphoesterase family protein [Halorussus caseinilyticus]|uniref:metallophosphoesterase family protein n=1 Tax=Halorussus caseinilyticus TaxID=3034025 RepID=UPI0023E7DFE0|nr:metallophosphoesterase [Halorussus sp. DT72]